MKVVLNRNQENLSLTICLFGIQVLIVSNINIVFGIGNKSLREYVLNINSL
jgi:hypothetical protein